MPLKEALLYEKLDQERVDCFLCSHRCRIASGKFGICNVRENRGGVLYTHSYGKLIARNLDPIEKKPLYHFHPGKHFLFDRRDRLQFPVRVLPELGDFPGQGGRQVWASPRGRFNRGTIAGEAKQTGGEKHLLYLHGADYLFRVCPGHRAAGQKGGPRQCLRHKRFHDPRHAPDDGRPCLDAANVDLKSFGTKPTGRSARGAWPRSWKI